MKIYSVTDYDTSFIYSTLGWAVESLSKYLNAQIKVYTYDELKQKRIERDTDQDVIFIFEIGNPQHCNITTRDLRSWWFPNAKFVALCSDTIYYQANGLGWQMQPEGIDLHLELMHQCIDRFKENNINADLWKWTGSEKLFSLAETYRVINKYTMQKEFDFIGVYGPWTIENPHCWRHHAVNYFKQHNYKFTNGGGTGHGDHDFQRLFRHYNNSWFTLGTTSHNRPELTRLGCMKGFRDWLGPILHSLLIYDKHDNVERTFNVDKIIPTYDYDNFDSIIEIYKQYKDNYKLYMETIAKQKIWAYENTLERQFVQLLYKHGYLQDKDIKWNCLQLPSLTKPNNL